MSSLKVDGRGWAAAIEEQLRCQFAKRIGEATPDELFRCAAAALRPLVVDGLMRTADRFAAANAKSVYYL